MQYVEFSIEVLAVYHMYLCHLESTLRQSDIDKESASVLLNLLDAIQEEEFAYDMQRPRPRKMIDYSQLDFKTHTNTLLMQLQNEKNLVNTTAQEARKALSVEDTAIQKSILAQVHRRIFHARTSVAMMAKQFLWEDEILQEQIMSIEATLRPRETVPFIVKGNATSIIRKEEVLGFCFLSLEEFKSIVTARIVDSLVSAKIVKLVSNKIFSPGPKPRTAFGISQIKTSSDSYVKFQDEFGNDYLILTRESNFYIDDLTL